MVILTYKEGKQGYRLGVKTEKGIVDVAESFNAMDQPASLRGLPISPRSFYESGLSALPLLEDFIDHILQSTEHAGHLLNETDLELGPCVPFPGKIICVGLNYRRHAAESGLQPPETPVLFSKFNNTIAASGEGIPLPDHVVEHDYEAELVVVMGRRARYVAEAEALDYVLGYCNGNDLSARDLQRRTSQWLLGKTLDKFMPIGPYLVTADEVGDPQNLPVRCWLNGELRQDSNSADMIFSVAQIVSYASQYMTLDPGDIITTGTPEGVILGMEKKVWLKPGDQVVIEIGNLGQLTNTMINEGDYPA
ncbi:MAG: fumarylacetoacetate hydrolase family protein [Anaerolineales bacterium]